MFGLRFTVYGLRFTVYGLQKSIRFFLRFYQAFFCFFTVNCQLNGSTPYTTAQML